MSSERTKPLLEANAARNSISVPVYSPYGGKEVVETGGSSARCLAGICSPVSGPSVDSEVNWVIRSSLCINAVLLVAKAYAFYISGSLAVLASLVDSIIDLLGQGALVVTSHVASIQRRGDYPVGRGRLEPVGVMICAVVMGMASIEVISTSVMRLYKYWGSPTGPVVVLTAFTLVLLVGVIVLKFALFIWCNRVLRRHPANESVKAIAQDNLNDVISNIAALFAPLATKLGPAFWVVDPFAGVAISIYIIYTWIITGYEQIEMIVGKSADSDFFQRVQEIASDHNPNVTLDQLTAYHFGPKYLVEIEVVMPETTTLRESHDEGIKLQHKIEQLEEVERCFVHIDYQLREHDDHDPEVPIDHKLYGGPRADLPRAGTSEQTCVSPSGKGPSLLLGP